MADNKPTPKTPEVLDESIQAKAAREAAKQPSDKPFIPARLKGEVPTLRVKHPTKNAYYHINVTDYDPEEHEVLEDDQKIADMAIRAREAQFAEKLRIDAIKQVVRGH